MSLVPATVVGAEVTVVIRTGDVTVELTGATPEQIALIVQAVARPTRDL